MQVKAVVLQSSILGLLYFLIYKNGFLEDLNPNTKLFADNPSGFWVLCDSSVITETLNEDFAKIFHF